MSVARHQPDEEPFESGDAEQRRLRIEQNRAAIALLDSWLDVTDDERAEQREAWEYLKRVLDEDRPPDAKLFK